MENVPLPQLRNLTDIGPTSNLPLRGRGSGVNPPNRFEKLGFAADGDYVDAAARDDDDFLKPRSVATAILEDTSRTILNHVDSPDLGFGWTVNPYRGCEHGCVYCYARPGHEYLGMSSGIDFETKILAKHDAPQLLQRALSKNSWQGEPIVFAGVTDVYQPIEADLEITRKCLEVCLAFRQPVSIITKNKLILRDTDIIAEMAKMNLIHAAISLTTLDNKLASAMEPRASSPRSRLDTIRALAKLGVPTTVMTAPIIPGLNDHELPALLREASHAGATCAGYVLLRLPHQIKEIFLDWLRRNFPQRAAKVEALIRDTREGELYNATFFERARGTGAFADQINATFRTFARKYKLANRLPPHERGLFRVPHEIAERGQLSLF
ncbi:MAG: PA0069 family radical SAM protein [Phycisphaerae bacterium]|jgi:DNA repair photolyase